MAIDYPLTIKTDTEKLFAVYSLNEQFRLEHNKIVARELPPPRWKAYLKEWRRCSRPLLGEQNRLRDTIRKKECSQSEWMKMSIEEQTAFMLEYFGDKLQLRELTTKATSPLLNELKALSVLELEVPPDPYEDFLNDYSENDPNNRFSYSTTRVTITGLLSGDFNAYVYKDHGANHFADFEHLIEIEATSAASNHQSAQWALTDAAAYFGGWTNALYGLIYSSDGSNLYVYLREKQTTSQDVWTGGSQSTLYFMTIARSGTSLTNEIRITSHSGNLEDTLTITCQNEATVKYRYAQPVAGMSGSGTEALDGYVQNWDLQEGVVHEKALSDSITVGDSIFKAVGQPQGDSIAVADSISNRPGVAQADSITIADSETKGIGQAQADAVAIAEGIVKVAGQVQADSIAIADSEAKAVGQPQADTVALADDQTKVVGQPQADTITIADTFSRVMTWIRGLADTIGITDVIAGVGAAPVAWVKALADTITISDSIYGIIRIRTRLRQRVARMDLQRMNVSRLPLVRYILRRFP